MRGLKYHIVRNNDVILIELSGRTKNNEALLAKRMLSHNLKEKGVRMILNLKRLEEFEPIDLIGALNTIRKQIGLLRGDLKLCSPSPELLKYLRENRLDRIFQIYETEQTAKDSHWRNYAKR